MATLTEDSTKQSVANERRRTILRPSRSRPSGALSPLIVPPPVPLAAQPGKRPSQDAPPNGKRPSTERKPNRVAPSNGAPRPRPRQATAALADRASAPDRTPLADRAPAPERMPVADRVEQRARMLALGASRTTSLRRSTQQPPPSHTEAPAHTTDAPVHAPAAPVQAAPSPSVRPRAPLARAPLSPRVRHRQTTLTVADPPRSRRLWARERPFHSAARCWAIGLLSVAAVALLTLYLTVPASHAGCTGTGTCTPNQALTLAYSVITAITIAITFYFLSLYVIGLTRSRRVSRRPRLSAADPLYVLVTPAHNEALVIRETVRCMLRLRGRFLMMVVNDGSTDDTGEIARKAGAGDERLIVIDRPPEIAGQGKGEVLNTAYREVRRMVDARDPRLGGATDNDVILCVLDADGWLRGDALEAVAPYFDDPGVAAVQIPVRMYNARRGFLACMQDIEFIGFSVLIQGGRDRLGSALLGGNGQFVRLAALRTLGETPWTRALTEDLDIGLRLARSGWVNRACVETCVAQQAVTHPRALLRQRTRWVQGHYSCWSHLPALWRAPNVRFSTRLDLSLHLLLATTILIVTAQAIMGVAGFFGVIPLGPIPLAHLLGSEALYRIIVLGAACGPLGILGVAYQRAAVDYQASLRRRLPWWSLPGVYLLFTIYVYFWGLPSTFRAFGRLALRRDGWAKTARDPLTTAEIDSGTRAVIA